MAILKPTELNEDIANVLLEEERINLNFGLSIYPFEIVSLVAPTGAGKTTLVCNLFAPLKKKVLYFSLEESKETMALRITKCCGKEALQYFDIIDQSSFASSKDDFKDILDTITEVSEQHLYAAIIIDHLTCISSLRRHKNPINLLKQPTVSNKVPLFIINQYQTVSTTKESQMAGGREMLFYATLSLELCKSFGKLKDLSEEEQILYDIDISTLQAEGSDGIVSLDAKRNLKFKSDNLRLLRLGQKNRYGNSFRSVLLDFDVENNKYVIFDKNREYTKAQQKIIIDWNALVAEFIEEEYFFDENNETCYKINKSILADVNTFLLSYSQLSTSELKRKAKLLKMIITSDKFQNSDILELKNLVHNIKCSVIQKTQYTLNPVILDLRAAAK
jgi:archaellum biogenesis ATPase FlaH